MKSAKDIAIRAIILLCLSDRCALEQSVIGGIKYSSQQREEQKCAIYRWLQKMGYHEMLIDKEKLFFEQPIGICNRNETNEIQLQYESIEPCLWSLGLAQKLSNYDRFVLDDFHPILQIGEDHNLEQLLQICKPRTLSDIIRQNEFSMLWHWRAIESNSLSFTSISIRRAISSIFGDKYEKLLLSIREYDDQLNDFVINGVPFRMLCDQDKKRTLYIALWRHHAFEWIVGNQDWDNVEVNT